MKNFAEEIAYLYFRLNGFFLLDNYVSHKSENNGTGHADNDILGIRPIQVRELVGLRSSSDICRTLNGIIDPSKFVGLICEVKGGETIVQSLNINKIRSCVDRIGFFDGEDLSNAKVELETNGVYTTNNYQIIKIFVPAFETQSSMAGWNSINLSIMINFLKERIEKYPEKNKSWNHTSSSLLQFLLYQSRGNNNGNNP